jgi:hypothetical protein
MSAALQLPFVSGLPGEPAVWRRETGKTQSGQTQGRRAEQLQKPASVPWISLAFYRKHTESMLRRYLYASMQVGRAPSILSDPVSRGWASSRPVRTFEDAVIFVLDIEKCINRLPSLDRQLLSRIVLQDYTQAEAATLLGMCVRTVSYKYPQALDRLTEKLLEAGLLILPR